MWTCVCGSRGGGEDNDSEACKDWREQADKVLLQPGATGTVVTGSPSVSESRFKKCMQCKQTLMEADKSALKNHYQLDGTGHFWLRCHDIGNVILQNLQAYTTCMTLPQTSELLVCMHACAHSKGIMITMLSMFCVVTSIDLSHFATWSW